MYKFAVLFALVACITAIPAPQPKPGYIAAPVAVHVAPAVLTHSGPSATSYANTYSVSYKSPVIAAAAPVVAGPVAYAAHTPVITHHAIAAAPVAYTAHHGPIVAIH